MASSFLLLLGSNLLQAASIGAVSNVVSQWDISRRQGTSFKIDSDQLLQFVISMVVVAVPTVFCYPCLRDTYKIWLEAYTALLKTDKTGRGLGIGKPESELPIEKTEGLHQDDKTMTVWDDFRAFASTFKLYPGLWLKIPLGAVAQIVLLLMTFQLLRGFHAVDAITNLLEEPSPASIGLGVISVSCGWWLAVSLPEKMAWFVRGVIFVWGVQFSHLIWLSSDVPASNLPS